MKPVHNRKLVTKLDKDVYTLPRKNMKNFSAKLKQDAYSSTNSAVFDVLWGHLHVNIHLEVFDDS